MKIIERTSINQNVSNQKRTIKHPISNDERIIEQAMLERFAAKKIKPDEIDFEKESIKKNSLLLLGVILLVSFFAHVFFSIEMFRILSLLFPMILGGFFMTRTETLN